MIVFGSNYYFVNLYFPKLKIWKSQTSENLEKMRAGK